MSGIVCDANDLFFREHIGQPYLRDFLAAHDIDWMLCHRFDVLPDGDGQLVAHVFSEDIRTQNIGPDVDISSDGWEIERWGYTTAQPLRAPLPTPLMPHRARPT